LRLFSFGGYGLALVIFGAIECPPKKVSCCEFPPQVADIILLKRGLSNKHFRGISSEFSSYEERYSLYSLSFFLKAPCKGAILNKGCKDPIS